MNFESRTIDFTTTDRPIVIAEVGVNHNCDIVLAKRMVDQAKACGADVVKFQAFVAEEEISRYADKAIYQKETTGEGGGQLEMAKLLELSHQQLREIKEYCSTVDMPFLCTAFDEPSLYFLVNELKVKAVKVASSEITNHPFLKSIARTGVGIILSTGASNLHEVEAALKVIKNEGARELVLLHCVSNYPAEKEQLNLNAIITMREKFSVPVGYSDHSSGTLAPTVAAALGAVLIEKHFTLDRNMDGPDHRASIEPEELKEIVANVASTCLMLGDGVKRCVPCEQDNQALIRKSLVASRALNKGQILSIEDIKIKRPARGIAPNMLNELEGRRLSMDIKQDQPIEWGMLCHE
ncbi:N-acetylneuraminate synthase [Agarilytica rhodophyticola]|uniref:N-acetylneuraminate synthase n=1 Tax=Agarilytica rhodophyticola TaxID=1737490 RepID=UPI000B343159|nr:N-acetylneuraminate synthase [Agarilytica rhodophyticola]